MDILFICKRVCLFNRLYSSRFAQSVIAIRTMLLVKINGGLGGATVSVPSPSAASAATGNMVMNKLSANNHDITFFFTSNAPFLLFHIRKLQVQVGRLHGRN